MKSSTHLVRNMLKEDQVDKVLRNHLRMKGWTETNDPRKIGQQDWDIRARHSTKDRVLLIECKGDGNSKYNTQKIHGAFWTSIGQVMARMDIQGNNPNKGRIYAIGIPKTWEGIFQRKARKMKYGWDFLKLRIFLVNSNKTVEEKTYRQFLR